MERGKRFSAFIFNFSNVNQPLFVIVGIVVALVIGYFNQTDIYERLNKLPEDRDEFTALKGSSIKIANGCNLYVEVLVDAITKFTFQNYYRNIKVRIDHENISIFISSQSADAKVQNSNSFSFSYKIPFYGEISAQLYYFDVPFGKKYDLSSRPHPATSTNIYNNNENIQIETIYDSSNSNFQNVCIVKDGYLRTFFKNDPILKFDSNYIKVIQGERDIRYFMRDGMLIKEKAAILWDQNKNKRSPIEFITNSVFPYSHQSDFKRRFIYNSPKTFSFLEELYGIINAGNNQTNITYCFDDLTILFSPSNINDSNNNINDNNNKKSFRKDITNRLNQNKENDEKSSKKPNLFSAFFYRKQNHSFMSIRDQLTKSVCPECDVNFVDQLTDMNNYDILQRISNSQFLLGVHHNSLIASFLMKNGTLIDIIPKNFECANWIFDLAPFVKVVAYFVDSPNAYSNEKCSSDCDRVLCQQIVESTNVDVKEVLLLDALKLSDFGANSAKCKENIVVIKDNGLYCLSEDKEFIHIK